MDKSDNAYKTIGEVAKILNLKTNKKGDLPTHIIRFFNNGSLSLHITLS